MQSADIDAGTGKIWLDDMHCTGKETELADCPNTGWGAGNCGHQEDIGIDCYDDGKHLYLIHA